MEPDRVTLDDAYALRTPEDSRALYARWAATYESDFVADTLYVIPDRVAEVFAEVAAELGDPLTAPAADRCVLDVGCGTGLVAAALVRNGGGTDWVIDGVDISAAMLGQAAGKRRADDRPLYRHLIEADLTGDPDIAAGAYAGLMSAGTFTHGHLGPEALSGLIRFGRRGAIFAIGINAEHFRERGFAAQLDAELAAGRIVDLQPRVVQMYLPGSSHEGETAVVAVFRAA